LPTTTRSSSTPGFGRAAIGVLLLALAACASGPAPAPFELPAGSLQHRAAETRWFETREPNELLSASAAVLQDLGFHVEESARELGFLRAAKERSAREHGQEIWRVVALIASFGKLLMPIDLEQKIAATLVARPADAQGARWEVRVTFYRVIWRGDGQSGDRYLQPGGQSMEMVRDPSIYQQFFARLSKAVFLEAYTL
jgi:hypothetical protein